MIEFIQTGEYFPRA